MEERWPFDYLPGKASGIQPHLRRMLETMLEFARGSG
jgi:N-formylglutamate deformylase